MSAFAPLRRGLAPLLAGTALLSPAPAATSVTVQKIALNGEQAHGLPTGALYSDFSDSPTISDDGQIIYNASLVNGGTITNANNYGLWKGPIANPQPILRRGDPAPGTAGALFSAFDPVAIDTAGRLTFRAFVTGGDTGTPSGNNIGIWNGLPGSLSLVMRLKSQAIGAGDGVIYNTLSTYNVGRNGLVGFTSVLSGPDVSNVYGPGHNAYAIWTRSPGAAPIMVLRGSQPAPGTSTNFTGVSLRDIGPTGSLWVDGTLFNPNPELVDSGSFVGSAGGLQLISRTNLDPAPGCPAGWVWRGLGSFTRNDAGAFYAASSALVSGSNRGLFYYSSGGSSLALLAKYGDPVSGASDTFSSAEALSIEPSGNGWAGVRLNAPPISESSICRVTPGGMTLVAREGSQAPGLPAGVLFGDLPGSRWAANGTGDLIFVTTLTGTGIVSGTNDTCLWHASPTGELTLLARRGTPFPVGPGDSRSPTGVFASYNPGFTVFKPQFINDNGQLPIYLNFGSGGRGLFLLTITSGTSPSLVVKSVIRTAAAVTLTFSAPPGPTIGVQHSETLALGSWMDLGNATVTGDTATFTDTNATRLGKAKGFYRAFTR